MKAGDIGKTSETFTVEVKAITAALIFFIYINLLKLNFRMTDMS